MERRQSHLAKLKSLLFYHEQKQKRINKIKSKTYRKIKKRQREKDEGKILEELKDIDPEAYADEQRKAEIDRAKERMSLQHTNSSKWMKRQLLLNKQTKNSDMREMLQEQMRNGQELRKKMGGLDNDDDSSQEEDSSDEQQEIDEEDDDEENTTRKPTSSNKAAQIRAKLRQLENELNLIPAEGQVEDDENQTMEQRPSKKNIPAAKGLDGIFALKFMQRAINRKTTRIT